eukprot:3114407-Pleurochrysis_carterae.AAC.2
MQVGVVGVFSAVSYRFGRRACRRRRRCQWQRVRGNGTNTGCGGRCRNGGRRLRLGGHGRAAADA